ncbi:CHAT domain-containing protein [Mycolicibacterium litorale]|uniref:CHAT domain-containing protein n=1 Tax=Mycolicibacterium litorale TaxID=758802 RepID=UPI003CE785AB
MTVQLRIPGQRYDGDLSATRGTTAAADPEAAATGLLESFDVVEAFTLSPSARARTDAPLEVVVEDDDVLEFEVEGGFTWWTSARRYAEEAPLLNPQARSGNAVTVDAVPRVSERGVKDWATSAVRVLRRKRDDLVDLLEDPDQWPSDLLELAQDLGVELALELPSWFATKALVRLIESRLRPGPGLYPWDQATRKRGHDESEPTPARFDDLDADEKMLVFVHGTGSSTRGSFGGFLTDDAQPQWQALRELFGDRIYAFEHRTFSDSPIDNAVDLVTALPRHARLSLVTHSRGGLVGDLISQASITAELIGTFRRTGRGTQPADTRDRRQLERLATLLADKQLRVERFVRCAAPSRGTLLVDENLDTFLSVLTNLVGLIPAVGGTPVYEVTKRIALEVIRRRSDPTVVPGIEAMVPTSPLVALLNNLDTPAPGDLGVVSGDVEGGNWLKRLSLFANDRFFYEGRDNDLVVNTDAMFHGARHALAGYVFDQGPDVSHFSYFGNPRTRTTVVDWLGAPRGQLPPRFHELSAGAVAPVPMPRALRSTVGAARPVVFVVPDVMGSHLAAGDREVWLHHAALRHGGMGDLADVGSEKVRPTALLGDGYRELCEYLQQSYEVIPFAYDWRRSIGEAALLLAGEIDSALSRNREPARIVAHGMGGLVVRAMIAARPETWDRLCERSGGAVLVMLGTPNRGSYDTVEMVLGTAASVQQLALLDLDRETAQIADILAQFPGVLESLPDDEKIFAAATWKEYQAQLTTAAAPGAAALAAARATLDGLAPDAGRIPHPERVHYVAGAAPRTVTGVEIVDGRAVLSVTTEGDGRVTYRSGRLPDVPMWYMAAAHGELAAYRQGFAALTDLLETGTTSRLSVVPPGAARGGPETSRSLPQPVLYPTETSLPAGVLGMEPRGPQRQRTNSSFRVTVVHGDLRYASHPIVVGHYEGDTIVGAEAQVDHLLGGALTQRYSLGLYPGESRSVAVILREPTAVEKVLGLPSGAVVMGLGKWGDLTAAELGDLLRRAALHYVLQLRDRAPVSSGAAEETAKAGLSVLLIGGSSTTNIEIGDSVGAILRAIAQVHRELGDPSGAGGAIDEIEIIELYADRAIEAAHALNRLAPVIGKELGVDIDAAPLLKRGRDGRRRLRSTTDRDAWRRWEVSVEPPARTSPPRLPKPLADRLKRALVESGNADAELVAALAELAIGHPGETSAGHRAIKFLTLSERARAESTTQQRQPELVERLIRGAISETQFRAAESRVLFELMIPNDLKSSLAQVEKLVLVVDAESAAYPWELMSQGDKALCLEKAIIRQLQTSSYRPQIGTRAGKAAYVVGDPQVSPPFSQLPGARAEAEAVYAVLRNRFEVDEPDVKPTALKVLAGLYERPYRIVHLAGHGYYESPATADAEARSGMVLDNGVYLTAVEVQQMQQVPELVFLNCCYLGQTGPEASSGVEFNRLAASVSRELIEMGVRAVVAAGWAVEDAAAEVFATAFYESMLDGETFGRAVKAARDRTYCEFRHSNTWGAYQAYGDPDYRLDPAGGTDVRRVQNRVDPAELIQAVHDVGLRATRGSDAAVADLQELVNCSPAEWLTQTDVLMEIGDAFAKLGQFEAGVPYLEAAIHSEAQDSTTTLRAVEMLANLEVRLADAIGDQESERARELLDGAGARLERLIDVAETSERRSLLGSAYKRRAAAEPDAVTAREVLTRSAKSYRQAHQRNLDRQCFDPYPVLNWLTEATLLGERVPDADVLIERCRTTARDRFLTDRWFMRAATLADVELVRALVAGVLGQDDEEADRETDRLVAAYREVIAKTAPNARDLDSVLRHIDITGRLLRKISPDEPATGPTTARLDELCRRIRRDDPDPRIE